MKFLFNDAVEAAEVFAPVEDGHWQPGERLGTMRVQMLLRNTVQAAHISEPGAAVVASVVAFARCSRSTLPAPGRFLRVRGQTYRIENVIEERDGFVPYQTMTLRQIQ